MLMILSKNEFCKIIRELIKENQFIDDFNSLCSSYHKDMYIFESGAVTTAIKILEIMFEDIAELISYWFWECECGTKNAELEIDGQPFAFTTAEDLYETLIYKKDHLKKEGKINNG